MRGRVLSTHLGLLGRGQKMELFKVFWYEWLGKAGCHEWVYEEFLSQHFAFYINHKILVFHSHYSATH